MAMQRINHHLLWGSILSATVVATALVGLVWTPWPPEVMNAGARLQGPNWQHLMGTDQYGRDIFSRVVAGAVFSVVSGLITICIGLSGGILMGLTAAWRKGWTDEIIMRFCDLLFGFPAILTALLLAAVFGPSLTGAMVAIGIFYIPIFARLSRALALGVWQQPFITAARACGLSEMAIARRHVMPHVMPPLLIQATVQFAVSILAEAGLSYLGLGVQPPQPSWGRMLYEAQTFMGRAPWLAIFPGLAIAWAVLGFNLLGDGLRDRLDPRTWVATTTWKIPKRIKRPAPTTTSKGVAFIDAQRRSTQTSDRMQGQGL